MKWVDDGEKWGDDMMGQDDAHEPPQRPLTTPTYMLASN